jgi:hypothetical protein
MKQKVTDEMREKVRKRAEHRCEYCLLPERDGLIKFHVEHIRSSKHGGSDDLENLAYACPDCNLFKGTDLGTILGEDETFTRFFNPRKDVWEEHFKVVDCTIYPNTEIGEATIKIFQMNKPERTELRQLFAEDGLYP